MTLVRQDRALAAFDRTLRSSITSNKVQELIASSSQKRQEFEAKHANEEKPLLKRGYTKATLDHIHKSLEAKKTAYEQSVQNEIGFTHHPVIAAIFNLLPKCAEYDEAMLRIGLSYSEQFAYSEGTKIVTMQVGRMLKNIVKLKVVVQWEKEFFKPAEDFATSKKVVKDIKTVTDTYWIKAKWGNIFTFRKSIIQQMSPIIEKHSFEDTRFCNDSTEDIWTFNF